MAQESITKSIETGILEPSVSTDSNMNNKVAFSYNVMITIS